METKEQIGALKNVVPEPPYKTCTHEGMHICLRHLSHKKAFLLLIIVGAFLVGVCVGHEGGRGRGGDHRGYDRHERGQFQTYRGYGNFNAMMPGQDIETRTVMLRPGMPTINTVKVSSGSTTLISQ